MAGFPGYCGQLLEIDLTNKTSKAVPLDPKLAQDYIGGRAMGVKLLLDAYGPNWAKIDPIGPEALLFLMSGPTANFFACKLNAVFKSPLMRGAIGSQVSGDLVHDIRFCGYDGIILKGKAAGPVVLYIEDDKVKFDDGASWWGKSVMETQQMVFDKYGNEASSVYIGRGGEKLVKYASIMTAWYRAAGRGGSGCVMGSKNVKAIVVKGNKPAPEVKDMAAFEKLREWNRTMPPFVSVERHDYGTVQLIYSRGVVSSSTPVKNWYSEWHDRWEQRAEFFAAEQWVRRYWADYACSVACSKLGVVRAGKYRGAVGELPDYESGALEGNNWGIYKIDEILVAADCPDKLGLDAISHGNVVSYAAECYEKGVLTQADLGGVDLKWGNTDAFLKISELIANRQGEIPSLLADGVAAAAKKIGKGSEAWANHVKGIEMGAHGARSGIQRSPAAYPCETQGGDHTSNITLADSERPILNDSLPTCSFIPFSDAQRVDILNAITGWGITLADINTKFLKRATTAQRIPLILEGYTYEKDDVNPPRWYTPLPEGPQKGKFVNKDTEEDQKQAYFKAMGWDARGIPTDATLDTHGLGAFKAALAAFRK